MKKVVLTLVFLSTLSFFSPHVKADISIQACDDRQSIVQKTEEKFKMEHQIVIGKYNRVIQNIIKSSERLAELGYDTSVISPNLENLKNLVMDYNTKYLDFDNSFVSLKQTVCTDSAPVSIKELQTGLKVMTDKSMEILDFFRNNLKTSLDLMKGKKNS